MCVCVCVCVCVCFFYSSFRTHQVKTVHSGTKLCETRRRQARGRKREARGREKRGRSQRVRRRKGGGRRKRNNGQRGQHAAGRNTEKRQERRTYADSLWGGSHLLLTKGAHLGTIEFCCGCPRRRLLHYLPTRVHVNCHPRGRWVSRLPQRVPPVVEGGGGVGVVPDSSQTESAN